MNCGIATHHEDCLCDVILREDRIVKSYVDPIRFGFYGREIAQHLGVAFPLSPPEILRFLEAQVALSDHIKQPFVSVPRRRKGVAQSRLLTDKQLAEIGEMMLRGVTNRDIIKHLVDTHDVRITKSHMSHLRQRLIRRPS